MKRSSTIYLDQSNISGIEIYTITRTLRNNQVSTAGTTVQEFEQAMAKWLGVIDCIATNSGTSALHLALMERVRPKDKVIIPALTFVATRNVLAYVEANPIIKDVDIETWLLPSRLYIGYPLTMVVDLYGNPFHGFATFYDSAESLGAWRGYHSALTCYSFNGNKVMTTGGGGLLVGPDLDNIRAKLNPGSYDGTGYNYRMPALNAALGLGQLQRLDGFLEKKRRFNQIYRDELPMLKFQEATPGSEPSWWMSCCLFEQGAEVIQTALKERDIPTKRIFKPLADRESCPNAWYIYDHGLCLPSSTLNEDEDILTVCKKIRGILEK